MADKEVTIYIVDVGKSMGEKHNGRNESDLDWSMVYVWDRITKTVATGRKLYHLGVLGLRTDDTKNVLSKDDDYGNITEFQPILFTQMSDIRELRDVIRPSNTDDGDAISALIVAIEMISTKCKNLKYNKKIVLVTSGLGVMDSDDVDEIAKKIKQDNIDLTIIGVDFDDPDFGFKEEAKETSKKQNEAILQKLVNKCDGVVETMAKAISNLGIPTLKNVRPIASYKGLLTLGNPELYDSAMSIEVERYPRVFVASAPRASKFTVKTDMSAEGVEGGSAQSSLTMQDGQTDPSRLTGGDGFAAVKAARTYQIEDNTAPGGKRDIDREELERGYEYGRTAVHISESDMHVVNLETDEGLDIVGFVPAAKFERYMVMSKSNVIIASKISRIANMALSSLIHALLELECYAIARFVSKDGKAPLLLLLAPSVESGYECLTDVEIPFAEDIRHYRFPPLDKVVTVGGQNLIQHRNLPSDQLMKAMSDYVDAMDLEKFGKDEQGDPIEYAQLKQTYSPVLHRIDQAVRWRAVHPTDEIPTPYAVLTRYSNPPSELFEKARSKLEALIKAGNVKKVPPKQAGRKRAREVEKPLSGLDVEGLLGREKRVRISVDNAIPEFKQLLATTEDIEAIRDAARQMGGIVEGYIRDSVGESGYGKAVEALRVMREEMVDLEEPEVFNDFMKELKCKMLDGKLNGDRIEMWYRVRLNRLGLIDKELSEVSDVTEKEAKKFYSAQK